MRTRSIRDASWSAFTGPATESAAQPLAFARFPGQFAAAHFLAFFTLRLAAWVCLLVAMLGAPGAGFY
jgi:hypothetical protein